MTPRSGPVSSLACGSLLDWAGSPSKSRPLTNWMLNLLLQFAIEIRHTVTCIKMDGKKQLIESDSTKTKSSKRTLPLVSLFREKLLALQQEQEENRRVLCTKNRHSAPKRTLCRFWRSIRDLNPGGAVNALSHFECSLLRPLEYISIFNFSSTALQTFRKNARFRCKISG